MYNFDPRNIDVAKALPNKKDAYIGLSWRGGLYKIGKASWSEKGLFVFRSVFHQSNNISLLWGYANLKEDKFILKEAEIKSYQSDIHITLHPPDKKNDGKMHVRASGKEILKENVRNINWFPVKEPFNLFHLYTPPIDSLKSTYEKIDFKIPILDETINSLIMRVDIYPRGTGFNNIPPASLIAYTPHFVALLTFSISPDRLNATMLWPSGSELKL